MLPGLAFTAQDGVFLQKQNGAFQPFDLFGTANTFTAAQTIDLGVGSTGISAAFGTHLRAIGADTANVNFLAATFGNTNGATFYSFNIGGTRTSQSATANGSSFWSFGARGHDGTAQTGTKAAFGCTAGSLWTGSSNETYWFWGGTPSGSTTYAEWMRLQGGNLTINATTASTSTTTGAVIVNGGIGIAGQITFDGTTGKSLRVTTGTANGAVATTLGSVGPTGSTAGNPQGWLRISVAGTDRFIPYW